MKKPKYHFLVTVQNANGKSIVTLPGQTFGQTPVPEMILVKDEKGSHAVSLARRKSGEGELFFTTTLRRRPSGVLLAADIHPLCNNQNVMYDDVMDEYHKYENRNSKEKK